MRISREFGGNKISDLEKKNLWMGIFAIHFLTRVFRNPFFVAGFFLRNRPTGNGAKA